MKVVVRAKCAVLGLRFGEEGAVEWSRAAELHEAAGRIVVLPDQDLTPVDEPVDA